jgi:hypothetical protein
VKLKYQLFAFVFFNILLFTPVAIWASHIVGGVITYKFVKRDTSTTVNKLTYHFTLRVYRDLFSSNGTGLDQNANIAVLTQGTTGAYTLYSQRSVRLLTQSNVAPPVLPCSEVPPNLGVEEGLYEWDETLNESPRSYVITYQRCCRNNTIANIFFPGTTGSTYTVEITAESQRTNNNSPLFNNFPPTLICANEPLRFDHSASDTEGDQLVYSFCGALIGASSSGTPGPAPAGNNIGKPPYQFVSYVLPNYSQNAPMGGNPVIKINPNTGLITGTPTALGQFVVTVCVEEYRNGVLGEYFVIFSSTLFLVNGLLFRPLHPIQQRGNSFLSAVVRMSASPSTTKVMTAEISITSIGISKCAIPPYVLRIGVPKLPSAIQAFSKAFCA